MHGVVELKRRKISKQELEVKILRITPEMATEFLERNRDNRPIRQLHVKRIARLISGGRWRLNGDSIKFDTRGDVVDGQHRLWAIFESQMAVDSVVVYGVERDAFATMDTNRLMRNGGDVVALGGSLRHRNIIASALSWLLRYQSGNITKYRFPGNEITNDRIEEAFAAHPEMAGAVERVKGVRRVCNISLIAFFYYVLSNRNHGLAERMVDTLEDPSGIAAFDPFFKLRGYFLADHDKKKDPLMTIALCIKAANAANARRKIDKLYWRVQGRGAEPFPDLDV